jgi:hypothetical protein
MVQILEFAILARAPYTLLKEAVYIRPTLAEGFWSRWRRSSRLTSDLGDRTRPLGTAPFEPDALNKCILRPPHKQNSVDT